MTDDTLPAGTRQRILEAAGELFAAQGYQRTSLREIADRLGVTKAAVLYHFPAKEKILTALTVPLLHDLKQVLDDAAGAEPDQRRWAVVEGMLDAFLVHRQALLMMRHDLAILTQQPDFLHRFLEVGERAHFLIAGPGADLADRVRAAQAVAILGDPVLYFADTPIDLLRELILDNARKLYDDGPSPAGRPTAPAPRRAGRPRALDPDRVATARRLYEAGGHTVAQLADQLGVSRATMYRHLRTL